MTQVIKYKGFTILLIDGKYYFEGYGHSSLAKAKKAVDNKLNTLFN